MASFASKGYYVNGVNKVRVRMYPQVLGIYEIHEHNLCNALRDFGLMIKSESRRHLLNYTHDFLKFMPLMRPSEICMIAHGYSLLELRDSAWWTTFTKISQNCLHDMDGKELAGLLYSLSRVYSSRNEFIDRLLEESKSWINLSSAVILSLMTKVASHFRAGPQIMRMLNARALEVLEDLSIVDVVFFMTSNIESKTQEYNCFRQMCLRCIELIEDVEMHHLRAIAASTSMGGFKSHILFNILTLKLSQITQHKNLKEGDVISLFLAFTTQMFIIKNDLCIDPKIYKNFLDKYPTSSEDIFKFPLPEFGPVLVKGIIDNKDAITANGMPILIRGISILNVPVPPELFDYLVASTCRYLDEDCYTGLKFVNLIMSMVRYEIYPEFWKAVHGTLRRQKHMNLNGDMVSKMINTISIYGSKIKENEDLLASYEILLEKSLENYKTLTSRSVMALNRHFSLTGNWRMITADPFLKATLKTLNEFSNTDVGKMLKGFAPFVEHLKQNDHFLELLKLVEMRIATETYVRDQPSEIRQAYDQIISQM